MAGDGEKGQCTSGALAGPGRGTADSNVRRTNSLVRQQSNLSCLVEQQLEGILRNAWALRVLSDPRQGQQPAVVFGVLAGLQVSQAHCSSTHRSGRRKQKAAICWSGISDGAIKGHNKRECLSFDPATDRTGPGSLPAGKGPAETAGNWCRLGHRGSASKQGQLREQPALEGLSPQLFLSGTSLSLK